MAPATKETTWKGANMDKAASDGPTRALIMAISVTITLKDTVSKVGDVHATLKDSISPDLVKIVMNN